MARSNSRAIKFGSRDVLTIPFNRDEVLPCIPQSKQDRTFVLHDLAERFNYDVYERVAVAHAMKMVSNGRLVSFGVYDVEKGWC